MNESTAQANGQAPVDHFAEGIAEKLQTAAVPRRRRWTSAQWHTFTLWISTLSCFFLMGFIVGHLS
jgi:hypothetical protein